MHRIAILDPNPDDRASLEQTLQRAGYETVKPELNAELLSEHLSMAFQMDVLEPLSEAHLILMERQFPNLDGITLIRRFKENKYTVQVPIMVITQDNRYESVLACVKAGAADYVVKPPDTPSLLRRVALLLGQNSQDELGQGIENIVWNFQDFLTKELKRSERSKLPVSIILARLGTSGQGAQSESSLKDVRDPQVEARLSLLKSFVPFARLQIRETDTLLRYGSQGIIAVLPMTSREGAYIVQERLVQAFFVQRAKHDDDLGLRKLDLFSGVSTFPDEATSKHDLLSKAEQNLAACSGSSGIQAKTRPASEQQVFLKSLFCPVCKEEFQTEKVRDRAFRARERESDFRIIYEKGNPLIYAVPVCPRCFYAAFFADFEQLTDNESAKLKAARHARSRLAKGVDFRASRTLDSGVVSYYLAVDCYQKRQTPPSTFARLYHRASWLLREAGNQKAEKEMLAKALEFYERSFKRENLKGKKLSDVEVAYLIGELSLRLGKPQQALQYFGSVIQAPKDKASKQLLELARERWYEAKQAAKS